MGIIRPLNQCFIIRIFQAGMIETGQIKGEPYLSSFLSYTRYIYITREKNERKE